MAILIWSRWSLPKLYLTWKTIIHFSSLMFDNVKLFSQKWSTAFILKDFTDEILLMYKNVPPQVWFKSFWSTTLTKIIVTYQRPLNYFVRGSITIRLTSCLTSWDSAAFLVLNLVEIYKFGRIQTSQTEGQPYSDTCPYEVCVLCTYFCS